ncbi:hypothetical protein PKHYL_22370 [Psychrobacter sp. KH172YL61]|nr:hypothetical protein PKHYL_22370 [Psychrobacter sp. KH172YL61]
MLASADTIDIKTDKTGHKLSYTDWLKDCADIDESDTKAYDNRPRLP